MAYHGGPTSLPRAHRPRAPIMSVPAPVTAPLAPLRQPPQQASSSSSLSSTTTPISTLPSSSSSLTSGLVSGVSLTTPRPECERATNDYVETPFRVHPAVPPPSLLPPLSPPPPPRVPRLHGGLHHHHRVPVPPPPIPVTKQPSSGGNGLGIGIGLGISTPATTFCKQPLPADCASRQSIICPECGNCRCSACQQPRPLPECWLCDKKCLCSADTIIDYVSCLCCAKALFYHCSESDGGTSCADNPCTCAPDRRVARWGSLAALSCVLPCLLFYWPLQCGKKAVETCYARHSRQGCRCRPPKCGNVPAANTPEKRLLDSSPDF